MSSHEPGTVTRAVNGLAQGNAPTDVDPVLRRLYEELRQLAASQLARDPRASLQPTELVHEAFLKLFRPGQKPWESRAHFFGAAGRAMQQLLIDHYRRRRPAPASLDGLEIAEAVPAVNPRQLVEALDELARHDARMAEIVNLRVFAGLTVARAAEVLGMSERHLKRNYTFALAWLYRHMRAESDGSRGDLPAADREAPP